VIVVAQRVREASVHVAGQLVGSIGHGLCLLVCALRGDTPGEIDWLADKIVDLRVFADEAGLTNLSLLQVQGAALVVPQFTLAADWRKGRRPSFQRSAPPEEAVAQLWAFSGRLAARGVAVAGGRFGAEMDLRLHNDGPFTLVLDSAERPDRGPGMGT